MKRRAFIISTVAGIGVISYSAYYLFGDVEFNPAIAKPQSLSLIWDAENIKAIGNQYRAGNPDESSVRSLVKLLDAPSRDADAIGSSINEDVTKDFDMEKTVIVDGWILSLTEARQCALASTIESK